MRYHLKSLACVLSLALVAAPAVIGWASLWPALAQQASEEVKQIDLTDGQIDNLLAAKKDIDAVMAKMPEATSDQPDPKSMAALDTVAKKHKFSGYGEYDDVSNTIGVVMSGIDPETKKYVGPETVIKKQIAQVQADKTMKAKDKKDALEELNGDLKSSPAVKNPANIDLVLKRYDQLVAAMSDDQ